MTRKFSQSKTMLKSSFLMYASFEKKKTESALCTDFYQTVYKPNDIATNEGMNLGSRLNNLAGLKYFNLITYIASA